MTTQWPSEREAANRQLFANPSFKNEQDFHQLMEACPEGLPRTFDEVAVWLVQQGGEIAELEQRITTVCNEVGLQNYPDSTNLLMTWACATALAQSPSLQTWDTVKGFKYNSWQIEHWLTPAMLARANGNPDAIKAYTSLGKEVFGALDKSFLDSKSRRKNQDMDQFWEYWKERRDRLDEIWWGLRGWNELNYEEEFPPLQVLNRVAPDEFISVVAESANPYLVRSALLAADVDVFSSRFAQWEKFSANAPIAFDSDSTWNGSVLAPLLLVEARDQLLQTGRNIPHFDASDADVDGVKREIASLVEVVVNTVATRRDALPLFARWSTWLMRQLLSHSEQAIKDVRSTAFVDDALIEAIGQKLKDQSVIQVSPRDAPAWEAWCYRCVLASHANNGFIEPPDRADFLTEWAISPEEWAGEKGQRLRERASFIVTISKEMPGMDAHLLAYPIVRSESPTGAWIEMWDAIYAIREIVEFGDADAPDDEYQSRVEAGKLLLLVFRIGLAIFDQRAVQCSDTDSLEARSQANLHEALASAVREMREIDNTLNREEWIVVVRNLAIRRLIWEQQAQEIQKPGRFPIFRPEDRPTFSDYLKAGKSDGIELLAVLQSVFLNDPDISQLKNELQSASVNLSDVLGMARRLNQYSPRRYPIDETQLQGIEGLNGIQVPRH